MSDTPLTDDYVASILQRDATRNNANRYLSSGLGSLLSGGRPRNSNAPKPNTRFLRNIVRDADSHNAALKRKEEEESRARLRKLKDEERGSKHRDRSRERDGRDRKRREGLSPREKDLKKHRHHSRSRERRREHRRSRSPQRESTRSRRDRDDHYDSPKRKPRAHAKSDNEEASDSDPLESLLGPKPPPPTLPRGRGAHKDSSINSRFDPAYDPKTDVALSEAEGDDWDMALEALKDRAKWRKSGAERLRAAGFTDAEVENWEKGGGGKRGEEEKDIADVKWRKKGEGREWDRGKVVDGGRVDVKAEWGRLKDT